LKLLQKPFWPALLWISALFLTRLPYFGLGYGAEGDSWRVARAAAHVWQTGHYEVSREPGYPVYEIINAPLWALGKAWAMNLATFVAFLFSFWAFSRLLTLTRTLPRKTLLILFAFFPLFWPYSASTMDYLWALALILWASVFLMQGKSLLAFALIGVSVGLRPSSAVFFFCALLYMCYMKKEPHLIIISLLIGLAIAFFSYSPALLTYGLKVVRYVPSHRSPLEHLLNVGWKTIRSIGTLGAIAVLISLVASRHVLKERFTQDRFLLLLLSFMSILLVPFIIVPDKPGYLILAMPWFFLVLNRVLKPRLLTLAVMCMLLNGFVDIRLPQHADGKLFIAPRVSSGILLEDYVRRREALSFRKVLPCHPLPEPTLLILGWEEMFWFENPKVEPFNFALVDDPNAHRIPGRKVYIVYLISETSARRAMNLGFHLAFLDGVEHYNRNVTGFDPALAGGLRLKVADFLRAPPQDSSLKSN